MQHKQIDVTPSTHLIRAIASQPLTWLKVIGEFVDNALDADARRIVISTAHKKFVVSDDGNGCKNLSAFFTLGGREEHGTTKLGRYGIGAKDGIMWIGGPACTVSVTSHHNGVARSAFIDWSEVEKTNRWEATEAPPTESDKRGTEIEIDTIDHDRGPDAQRLIADLGYIYWPALMRERKILLRLGSSREVVDVPAWTRPRFEEGSEIKDTIDFGDGRCARIQVGLVAAGEKNPRAGLTYAYGYRVIIQAGSNGCGEFDHARVCGVVELVGKKWGLSKNKDALTKYEDELYSAVEARLRSLLERAHEAAHTLESEALRHVVESQLNAIIAPPERRAKRGDGDDEGTKRPTGAGGKHKRAKNEQPGRTFGGCRANSVRLSFPTGWEQGAAMGRVDLSKAKGIVTVSLFRDHPVIARALKTQTRELVAHVALMHLAVAMHVPDGRQGALFQEEAMRTLEQISRSYAGLSETPLFLDGRELLVVPPPSDVAA